MASISRPGIQTRKCFEPEILGVSGNDRQSVFERGGGDEGISFVLRIGTLQAGTSPRGCCVDGQNATRECGEHEAVEPGPQQLSLCRVAALNGEHTLFDFQMVITETNIVVGATRVAHATTLGSARPRFAFRNSDITFASSRYIN